MQLNAGSAVCCCDRVNGLQTQWGADDVKAAATSGACSLLSAHWSDLTALPALPCSPCVPMAAHCVAVVSIWAAPSWQHIRVWMCACMHMFDISA
jgi:hypothetical protein